MNIFLSSLQHYKFGYENTQGQRKSINIKIMTEQKKLRTKAVRVIFLPLGGDVDGGETTIMPLLLISRSAKT